MKLGAKRKTFTFIITTLLICAATLLFAKNTSTLEAQELILYGDFDSCPMSATNSELNEWIDSKWAKEYEKPKGSGCASISIDNYGGRNGGKALKMTCKGNRGIVRHKAIRVSPGTYKLSAWMKCSNTGKAKARLALMHSSGKGAPKILLPGKNFISGNSDWIHIENTFKLPEGVELAQPCLLTDEADNGTVWWDDVSFYPTQPANENIKLSSMKLKGFSPENRYDALTIKCATQDKKIVRVLLYCSEKPFKKTDKLTPCAILDNFLKSGTHTEGCLETGKIYYLAAKGIDIYGNTSPLSKLVRAIPLDKKAPHKPELTIKNSGNEKGQLLLKIKTHFLDDDLESFQIFTKSAGKINPLKDIGKEQTEILLKVPANARKLCAIAMDKSGNRSEMTEITIPSSDALKTRNLKDAPCQFWVEDSLLNVFKDFKKPEKAKADIKVAAMINEKESCQLLLRSDKKLQKLSVRFEDLKNNEGDKISADNFTYNFVDYVRLKQNSSYGKANPPEELLRKAPADFPDPLSDEKERLIKANETQAVYLSFYAPRDTKAGVYKGNVFVKTDKGEFPVNVEFEVFPCVFPDKTRLIVNNWTQLWENIMKRSGIEMDSLDRWKMTRKVMKMMRKHHQNSCITPHFGPFIWTTPSETLIKAYMKEDGEFVYDFSSFDRYVKMCLKEGVGEQLHLSHWAKRENKNWASNFKLYGIPARKLENGQRVFLDPATALKAIQKHIKEKGWQKNFMTYIADEPVPANVETYEKIAKKLSQAAPDIPHVEAIQTEIKGNLNTWVFQIDYYDRWKSLRKKTGKDWWFYLACVPQGKYTNRFIDMQCIKSRLKHWMGYRYDAKGYLHAHLFQSYVNNWIFAKAPGDGTLIWRGKEAPISSIRYEAERDGIEDSEYMLMLEDSIKETGKKLGEKNIAPYLTRPKEIISPIVKSFTDYKRDFESLDSARRILAKEISQTKQSPLVLSFCEPSNLNPIEENSVVILRGICEENILVEINGQKVESENGRFSKEIILNKNTSVIKLKAKKGNIEKELTREYFFRKKGNNEKSKKQIVCNRLNETPMIDGNVKSDPCWQKVPPDSSFSILRSKKPASEKTILRTGYTQDALYISMICNESDMNKLQAKLKDMQDLWKEDSVEIFISPDQKNYAQFIANALGSKYCSETFGATWRTAVSKDSSSWSIEIKIPFDTIGSLPPANGNAWKINFCRNTFTPDEEHYTWSFLPKGFHDLDNFGTIIFKDRTPNGSNTKNTRRK